MLLSLVTTLLTCCTCGHTWPRPSLLKSMRTLQLVPVKHRHLSLVWRSGSSLITRVSWV
jgi:hypothetical protein